MSNMNPEYDFFLTPTRSCCSYLPSRGGPSLPKGLLCQLPAPVFAVLGGGQAIKSVCNLPALPFAPGAFANSAQSGSALSQPLHSSRHFSLSCWCPGRQQDLISSRRPGGSRRKDQGSKSRGRGAGGRVSGSKHSFSFSFIFLFSLSFLPPQPLLGSTGI
jgi:hypothetical protein